MKAKAAKYGAQTCTNHTQPKSILNRIKISLKSKYMTWKQVQLLQNMSLIGFMIFMARNVV